MADAALSNIRPPLTLDVSQTSWPAVQVDAVFSANTAHIMHWHEVQAMFSGVAKLLSSGGLFVLYGPFNHANAYTSESNARFDAWLRARDPESGLRDSDALDRLAINAGMMLIADYTMPVNNRILVWRKQE
jgi:cyclopropane fatty-acyl-phospholipid synthase-like methyltransferase